MVLEILNVIYIDESIRRFNTLLKYYSYTEKTRSIDAKNIVSKPISDLHLTQNVILLSAFYQTFYNYF